MAKVLGLMMLAATAAAGFGAYTGCPSVRTFVSEQIHAWRGWTEASREADPVGFANYVEGRLEKDLKALERTRRELQAQVADIGRAAHEQQAMTEHAEKLTDEFRRAYRVAKKRGTFPVTVREAAYTEEQVVRQVSLLLAQANGNRQGMTKLNDLRKQTEQRLEDLTVRIDDTQRQQAAIAAQRSLLMARVLSDEGTRLMAQLDALLDTNRRVVHDNPVRSVQELLATDVAASEPRASLDAAREFLTAAAKPNADEEPVARQPRTATRTKTKPNKSSDRLPIAVEKPIFQQS